MDNIMQLKDFQEALAALPDAEAKLGYLIELGDRLPAMPAEAHTEANRIRGCASQVWIEAQENQGRLIFRMDSDAKIVRGLLFILQSLTNGKTREEIKAAAAAKVFADLGLSKLLSSQRQVGLQSAIDVLEGF